VAKYCHNIFECGGGKFAMGSLEVGQASRLTHAGHQCCLCCGIVSYSTVLVCYHTSNKYYYILPYQHHSFVASNILLPSFIRPPRVQVR